MEKTDKSINKIRYLRRKREFVVTNREILFMLFVFVGFFIGRVLVFDYLNPAIVAYLSVFLGTGASFYITSITALLGIVTNTGRIALTEYLTSIALLGIVNYYILQSKKSVGTAHKALIGALCGLTGGLICAALNSFSIYSVIISGVEAIVTLSLTIIFIVAYKTISNIKDNPVLNNDQLIGISVLMGLCFVGMDGLAVKGIYFRDILSLATVLTLSYAGGPTIGCSTGLIFSIIMFAGAKYSPVYTGILGVSGIMGGLFKDFGKAGSSTAFIAGCMTAALYLDNSIITSDFTATLGISVLIFVLIPKNIIDRIIHSFIANNSIAYENYIEKVKDVTSEKLLYFSESFKQLSGSFRDLAEKKDSSSQGELSKLVDTVAQNVCRLCSNFEQCWVNNLYLTYQSMYDSLVAADKRGSLTRYDLPQELRKRCVSQHDLLEITNRLYSVYKTDIKWHNRVIESRELVSQQLKGVADILNELSRDVRLGLNFIDKFEKIISQELEKEKIEFDSVTVIENKHGRIEVKIITKTDIDKRLYGKKIITDISSIVGRCMLYDSSVMLKNSDGYKIKLIEEYMFSVLYGAARTAKDHSAVSGDNFTSQSLDHGLHVVALSDGMGTGNSASKESILAIELMEQLLESGFEDELTMKLINSALLLKSDEDFFTTFDVMIIDKYSGICKAIKIGAVETFLIRDDKVKILRQSSLPVGILPKLEIESASINLKDNDTLLIVSDGITDAGSDNEWIGQALSEFKSLGPQSLAEYIVERAKVVSSNKVKDDMTAIVVRISKKSD